MQLEKPSPSRSKTGGFFLSLNPLLHELPSYQSLIRRTSAGKGSTKRRNTAPSYLFTSLTHRRTGSDELEQNIGPLREMPVSIEEKKRIRASPDYQTYMLTKYDQGRLFRKRARFIQTVKERLSSLYLWKTDIHDIEAQECTVYEQPKTKLVLFYSYVINLFSGTGFLEQTYLFYGFYKFDYLSSGNFHYNLSLAYFMATCFYILLSLFWVVKRAVEGFKQSFIRSEDRFQSFCNKIFAGWDFCITDQHAAKLKHSSLQYELKTDLNEERMKQKIADRTKKEKFRIYLLRVFLNLVVLMILFVCFYCIYETTVFSQKAHKRSADNVEGFTSDLIVEYLPSIVITAANFITPRLFERIIQFEDYSPAFEIKFILIRSVFVRLANIIVLLLSLWSQITTCDDDACKPCGYNNKLYPCWETRIGQEMYKLMIFDLIIISSVALFVEFPRKLIVTYCTWAPFKWWGQQQFSVPQNVLEIVYGQTICWIGTFYSPLLPGIATIKYFIIFYIKKISLMNNCRPSTRPFRASSSNFFFLAVLLIGLPLACVPIVFSVGVIKSSKSCGPFVKYNISWHVIPATIDRFPKGFNKLLYGLASEAFAVPFFLFVCLILFYLVALAGAHKRVIDQLREQLAMHGRDKQYLIKKLTRDSLILKKRSTMSSIQEN
ncbi:transmembrane channel-like protein 7 isoform X2 [Stegostoma tigrinum]|uniref:transmembrane channel-like protein 7 isoform X2 n=1 Tax=Stegostoma tigrinum TaxID=3053191 RepID=UPI00287039E8|nr:transmembrane channel-like protein 7 isoform X2 [Stegostoma tigrinum]